MHLFCGLNPIFFCLFFFFCILAAIWKHPEPRPTGRERGEAQRGVHAVFQRGCVHQEDRSGERGEGGEIKKPWVSGTSVNPGSDLRQSGEPHLCDMLIISVPQVEVIGGVDKYQAACRKCHGRLIVEKENCSPCREETPPHDRPEKLKDSAVPKKLFSALYLWRDSHSSLTLFVCIYFCNYWNVGIPENKSMIMLQAWLHISSLSWSHASFNLFFV